MIRASLLAIVVVVSIPVAGCGKVDPSGAPTEVAPIAMEQFCGRLTETACGIVMPCCKDGGFPVDLASCQSRFRSDCESRFLRPKEGTSWSAENAGRCIAEIQTSVINCAENPDSPLNGPQSSCNRLFVGVLALGANCPSNSACAPSASGNVVCLGASGTSTGICSLEKLAAPGEPCGGEVSGTVVKCAANAYCKFDSATRTQSCIALAAAGGKCDPDSRSCQDGLTCDSSSSTCSAPHEIGERCNSISPSACVETAYCEYSSSTCIAKKAIGAACTTSTQCTSKQCSSGVCSVDTIASKESCPSSP